MLANVFTRSFLLSSNISVLVANARRSFSFSSFTMRPLRTSLGSLFQNHLVDYPTPLSLTYFWGFGSVAGLLLTVQIVTGLFLTFHYAASTQLAFDTMEHIMRDVNYG